MFLALIKQCVSGNRTHHPSENSAKTQNYPRKNIFSIKFVARIYVTLDYNLCAFGLQNFVRV